MKTQLSHVPSPSGTRSPAIRPSLPVFMAVFSVLSTITPVHAATKYWSGNGSTAGGDGTWNTTTVNRWATAIAGPWTLAWANSNNDIAENSSATANITLGTNITLGGFTQKAGGANTSNSIEQGSGPFTLTLGINGANTFLAAANTTTGRSLIVNAAIAGGVANHLVLAGPATSGTGNITLGRANTFSGTTTFSAGATGGARVTLKHQLALQNSTVVLSSKANLLFDSSVSANAFALGGLTASSAGTGFDLALQNTAGTPTALTVGANNTTTTYKGVLSAGGSLIKTGSGTLTLSGANTYSGTTTVSSGILQVDGSTDSTTTIHNGATLAGSGLVNAAVTVAAGGSIIAAEDNLTVSNLTFSGTATLDVGTLSGYTSTAAITVTNALTVSGGAAAVMLNLPTAPGFNGTYHLIEFGSGSANASGFTLGTVPTLAWNQTGALQVNGNNLDYVITAAGDTTPPTLANTLPANNATNVLADADLVATFDETVVAGSGSIELRRSSDAGLVESFNVTLTPQLTFSSARLIIKPTNDLPAGQYYVLIPTSAVNDTSGNNYAGITSTTGWNFTVSAPAVLYTDTGSPANPPWSEILPTLNVQSPDTGPVYGSLIDVNNAAVEVGLYGNRTISVPSQRIHVACNTSTTSFSNFTRWFQTDGKTHILRVFVDDENTATTREGTSSHTEAFNAGGWNYTDNMTYEWTARYTIARLQQGYSAFQLKNSDNDWAFQLGMAANGSLTVNNRNGTDAVVTHPDGSAKDFTGRGFDVRVLDDGLNYKVWIDGVLYADRSYSRPTGTTNFRWGMYFGANNLNPPADFNIVLVSGAQVKSWPGNLNTATSTITKANNTTNLNSSGSWVDGVNPGLHNQALWNSTVAAANTATLASYQQWAGLEIVNPGGTVTLNGSAILGLDDAGVDMTAATQNLTVNCPVQLTAPSNWGIAAGRTATFSGIISGYPGLTLNGGGTVQLNAANTYSGETTLSAGTLVANNNSALGTGLLVFNGGNLSNTASVSLGNDVSLSSNASVNVAVSQTLTLMGSLAGTGSLTKTGTGTLTMSGANTYTGATIVSAGTLAIGKTSALLPTTSLTLAAGTLLQPNLDGVIITAPVTMAGSGTTATISAPTNAPGSGVASTLTLRSVLAGGGNVTFSSSVDQNALPTVYLAAQSTYAGSTLLNTTATTATHVSANQQIIVKLGINNALPPTTVLTIDGGTGSGSGRFAELNLNGFNQQLAGLTNIPRSFTSPGGARLQRVVNSNISPAATLTIHNSGNHTFSGNLGSDIANGSVSAAAMPGSTNGNNFGLTKSGAGIFTLAGASTYTGVTTISAGTLALGANHILADTTAVFIGNATLNASTFTDTVGSLDVTGPAIINLGPDGKLAFANSSAVDWTGGTLAITGTFTPGSSLRFGTTNSGLTPTQLALITATGFGPFALDANGYLIPGVMTDYTSWKNTNAPTGAPGGDFDGDGVANGVEYALGGTSTTNDLPMLPQLSSAGGDLIFTFIRDQASIDGTTILVIELGNNLAAWPTNYPVPTTALANNPGLSVTKNSPVAGKDTITLTLPLASGGQTFARLKVTP